MLLVTGDKHQSYAGLLSKIELLELNEKDTIIVLGDMGLFWREDKSDANKYIKFYEDNYNCNIWFIDGNHENHILLRELPIVDKLGYISPHIKYIPRGTVLDIENKHCLFLGGAESIDKAYRIEGKSWWKEETITREDIDEIKSDHYDYVFTHTCPESIFNQCKHILCSTNTNKLDISPEFHKSEKMLEEVKNKITFDKWYFGHFHKDVDIDEKFSLLYHDFKEII